MTGITIAGETFNVCIEGGENKESLMLSNPMGTNLHVWDPQIPALTRHFRVVRYDSRGHGASVANQGPYSLEGLGRDALAIMDALGIERVHWLGLSMGSMVGLWLLVHARERIGRAVLASTAAQLPGPDLWNNRIQSARDTGMHGVAMAAAERWFTKTFRDANPEKVERVLEMVQTTPLHGYLAACAAIRDMDQRESIRSITNKVLVIAGRHDPSTPPGMGALAANSIEGAKFVTLETSHMSNIEDAANFIKAAVDFLTAPEATAARPPPRPRAPAKKMAAKKAPARKTAAKKPTARTVRKKRPGTKPGVKKKTSGRRKS
jgi:3-oxoadipate enol-lactonase